MLCVLTQRVTQCASNSKSVAERRYVILQYDLHLIFIWQLSLHLIFIWQLSQVPSKKEIAICECRARSLSSLVFIQHHRLAPRRAKQVMSGDGSGRASRDQRLSKERMEEMSAGEGLVYDASGRKLRKPRLSSEEIPGANGAPSAKRDVSTIQTPLGGAPLAAAFTGLTAAIVTMLAFKMDFAANIGLEGVPPEYLAPVCGCAAALLLQQVLDVSQRMLTVD